MSIQTSHSSKLSLNSILAAGHECNWHYMDTSRLLGLGKTKALREVLQQYDLEWADLALEKYRKHAIAKLAQERDRDYPSLNEVIAAAHLAAWKYQDCAKLLGFPKVGSAFNRFLRDQFDTSWAELIDSQGVVPTNRNMKGPATEQALAKWAKHFEWNQSAVAKHFGMASHKTGFSRRIKRWGYRSWNDFCLAHGKPEQPELSLALLRTTAATCDWNAKKTAIALNYVNHGAVSAYLRRQHDMTWLDFKRRYAPMDHHVEPLTIEGLIDIAETNDWNPREIRRVLREQTGYQYADHSALRRFVARRGYDGWLDFKQQHCTNPELLKPKTRKKPSHRIADVAAKRGWHIDLTAWALDMERDALLNNLKEEGYRNWIAFYEKYGTPG